MLTRRWALAARFAPGGCQSSVGSLWLVRYARALCKTDPEGVSRGEEERRR